MDGLNFLFKTWSLNMSGFEKMPYAALKLLKLYEDDPSPSGVITGLVYRRVKLSM